MKKVILLTIFLLGLSGCGTNAATSTSKTEASKKADSSISQSSSVSATKESVSETKQSISETSKAAPEPSVSSTSEEKDPDAEFKELVSGIKYNKEYLTEDEIAELKEMYKAELTKEQYQEVMKVLGE